VSEAETTPITIESFALRQTGNRVAGVGSLRIDNLSIATDLTDVIPSTEPSTTVVLSTVEAIAYEEEAQVGRWTVTRTGDLAQALTVNLRMSGTAVQREDFHVLFESDRIVFEPGQYILPLILFPLDDAVAEESETMTITLLEGTGYELGLPTQGTIEIIDNDPPMTGEQPEVTRLLSIDQEGVTVTLPSDTAVQLQRSTDLVRWESFREIVGTGEALRIGLEEFESETLFLRVVEPTIDVQQER